MSNTSTHPIPDDIPGQIRLAWGATLGRWADQYPDAVADLFTDARHFTHVPLGDIERTVQTVPRYQTIGVNPLAAKPAKGRGKKADRIGHTHLVVDIDIAGKDNGHKTEEALPTMQQAREMIADAQLVVELPPTIVVQSSRFGIHAWWALDEVIPDPGDQRLLASHPILGGWRYMWDSIAEDYGVHIDMGVVACNSAQILRMPGQLRSKPGSEDYIARLVRYNPDSILSTSDLPGFLPTPRPAAPAISAGQPAQRSSGDKPVRGSTYTPSHAERVIDQWNPLAWLDLVCNGQIVDSTHWLREGSSNGSSAELVDYGDGPCVVISSDSLAAAMGIAPRWAAKARLTTSSIITRLVAGDWATGQRIMQSLARLTEEEARRLMSERVTPWSPGTPLDQWRAENIAVLLDQSLVAGYSAEAEAEPTTAPASEEPITAPSLDEELMAALRNPCGQIFHATASGQLTHSDRAAYDIIIGGGMCGIYKVDIKDSDDDEEEEERRLEQITSACVVRVRAHTLYNRIRSDAVDDGDTYDVLVIAGGRSKTLRGLTPDQSIDIAHIITKAGIGGTVPVRTDQRRIVGNLLLNVALSSIERGRSYQRSGWSEEGGELRHVLHENSMTTSGIDNTVGVELGVTPSTGFTDMPTAEDFAHANEMFEDMFTAAPNHRGHIAAIVTNALAAPIRVRMGSPNVAVFVHGHSDSGKTRLTYLGRQFVTPTGRWANINIKGDSPQSVAQTLPVESDVVCLLDDLKQTRGEGYKKLQERIGLAHTAIDLCYERNSRTRGTTSSRASSAGCVNSSVYISSEEQLSDYSMTTKSLCLPVIRRGDIDFTLTPQLDVDGEPVVAFDGKPLMVTPVDGVIARWHATAGRLYAGWIRWLMDRIIAAGSIDEWAAQNTSDIKRFVTGASSRSREQIARLTHAWARFTEYVEANGGSVPDYTRHLVGLASEAEDAAKAMSVEAQLGEALRGVLSTKRGHLTNGAGVHPALAVAHRLGWADRGGQGLDMSPMGPCYGLISDDLSRIMLTAEQAAMLLPEVNKTSLKIAMTNLVPDKERARYGDSGTSAPKHPRRGWAGEQSRGWAIPVEALGIELGGGDED